MAWWIFGVRDDELHAKVDQVLGLLRALTRTEVEQMADIQDVIAQVGEIQGVAESTHVLVLHVADAQASASAKLDDLKVRLDAAIAGGADPAILAQLSTELGAASASLGADATALSASTDALGAAVVRNA